jgi:hypothetical protein
MTSADLLVPAAQYLRMSTEHQQYSFENHSTAIQKYAGATLNSVHAFDTGATFTSPAVAQFPSKSIPLSHRVESPPTVPETAPASRTES